MATKQVLIVGTMTWDEGADSGNVPANPIYTPPVFPAHPIAPPGGGGVGIAPPIYYPPVFPAHPIAPPGGGGVGIMPPIYYPPSVSHPIAPGGPPLGIWGPPTMGHHPAHPIAPGGPGEPPPVSAGGGHWEWVWTPGGGWSPGYVPGDKPTPPPGGGGTPPTEPPVDPNAPVVTPH
jgi:hypothetical protein